MNTITRIQVEFGELATQLQIPVRHVTATASRLPGVEWVDSSFIPGNFTGDATYNGPSVETDRFITKVRELLRKRGAR